METGTTERPAEYTSTPEPAQSANVPGTAETGLHVLQICLHALGIAILLMSVFFNLFLYKQNNLLIAQIDAQTRMLNLNEPLFDSNSKRLDLLVQDLSAYAQQHPDLAPMLVKYKFLKVPQSMFNPSTILPSGQ